MCTPLNTFIFDIDDTLINSQKANLETWKKTFEDYHINYDLKQLKSINGIPILDALNYLKFSGNHSDFLQKWIDNYNQFKNQLNFFPGIIKMLNELKKNNMQIGIVTSRDQEEYERYIARFHLEKYASCIVLSEDTQKHKPYPDPIEYYLGKTKAKSQNSIYIGDMPTDIESAHAAHIKAGLVTWNGKNIFDKEADYIFKTPIDVTVLNNIR